MTATVVKPVATVTKTTTSTITQAARTTTISSTTTLIATKSATATTTSIKTATSTSTPISTSTSLSAALTVATSTVRNAQFTYAGCYYSSGIVQDASAQLTLPFSSFWTASTAVAQCYALLAGFVSSNNVLPSQPLLCALGLDQPALIALGHPLSHQNLPQQEYATTYCNRLCSNHYSNTDPANTLPVTYGDEVCGGSDDDIAYTSVYVLNNAL